MKKILSLALAATMATSLFTINTSAIATKDGAVIFSQDYEDPENRVFGGATAVGETEDEGANKVGFFASGNEKTWEVETPEFTIDQGLKLTFRAMVRDENSLSLLCEVYGGTKVLNEHRGFCFATNDLETNVWYDGEITIRATDWSIYAMHDCAKLIHPETGEIIWGEACNTLSSNGRDVDETDDGVDNPVTVYNYTNRIRFLTNASAGPAGNGNKVTVGEGETIPCDWIIDDIKGTLIEDVPTYGYFHGQDYEDFANGYGNSRGYNAKDQLVYLGGEHGFVRDFIYTGKGTYSDAVTYTVSEEDMPLATDSIVTTFDVRKMTTAAPGFVVTIPRADAPGRVGVVSKQLLPEVWYNFAIVRPAKGALRVYRKQATETEWTELTGVAAANAVDAPAVADGKDVEAPIFINNTSSGNNTANLMRLLVSTVAYMNVYQGADAPYNVAATPLTDTHYQFDNYKAAAINDLEAYFTDNEGAVDATIKVADNDPTDIAEKNVFIGYYAEGGALVDVDFAPVANGEAQLSLTAEGKAEMDYAKLYLWDANNTPVMDGWNITNNL